MDLQNINMYDPLTYIFMQIAHSLQFSSRSTKTSTLDVCNINYYQQQTDPITIQNINVPLYKHTFCFISESMAHYDTRKQTADHYYIHGSGNITLKYIKHNEVLSVLKNNYIKGHCFL
jgi:hypothetical protein